MGDLILWIGETGSMVIAVIFIGVLMAALLLDVT